MDMDIDKNKFIVLMRCLCKRSIVFNYMVQKMILHSFY